MIFYFTGTGNSLFIAKMLEDEIFSIPQVLKQDNLNFKSEKIGIVCPIYGHEMPNMVKSFIRKATFQTEYFYVVLTYGALHGGAAQIADQYIKSVGKQAQYIKSIVMVDNFLPNFDMEAQCAIDKKIPTHLAKIKADIDSRKCEIEKAGFINKMIHKSFAAAMKKQDAIAAWTQFTVQENCNGCGICAKVCPAGTISVENGKSVHLSKNCQACYACIHACPQKAIILNPEKNRNARYRNEHITLEEIVQSNNQYK